MANRAYTTEATVRLMREIYVYQREVRAEVTASHEGEFVVADVTPVPGR